MWLDGGMQPIPDDWFDIDSLGNYSFVFSFEASFDRRLAKAWLERNWSISIWAAVVYIALAITGDQLMRYKKEPFQLRGCLCAWNVVLSSFSVLAFLRLSSEFFRTLTRHGFVHSVCQPTGLQDQVVSFWAFAFLKSKYFELFDTAFIILRRRPLTFLHCFHHATVLAFCWYSAKELTAATRWFGWMNYGVHSFMYTYYAVRAFGVRIPRAVSVSITSLQILQMLIGCWIGYTAYKTKLAAWHAGLDPGQACYFSWRCLYVACALYVSYLLLFLRYFIRSYVYSTPPDPKVAKRAALENVDAVSAGQVDRQANGGHRSNGHQRRKKDE